MGIWVLRGKRQFEWAVPWKEATHGSYKVKGGPNKNGYHRSVFKVTDRHRTCTRTVSPYIEPFFHICKPLPLL